MGYFGKADCDSSLEDENWGIYRGLTIILEKSMSRITIELDALMAVKLINEGDSVDHPQRNMIKDAHAILTRTESTLQHIYREVDQYADRLARIGAEKGEDPVVSTVQPISLREFWIRDHLNLRQILD